MTNAIDARAKRIVENEIHLCVSALVHTLATGGGMIWGYSRELADLAEQAAELAFPIPNFEEAARDLGYDIRHDIHGYYVCTTDEADHEDEGNASVGFDGREHYETVEDAARAICEENDQDAYEREVFEHWAISDWLADKLAAKGEKVDKDFANLTVWARTTTGQAIYMDSVIQEIAADLVKEYGE